MYLSKMNSTGDFMWMNNYAVLYAMNNSSWNYVLKVLWIIMHTNNYAKMRDE